MSGAKVLNSFQEKTLEGLNITQEDGRLSSGFDMDYQDYKQEDCILVIGLNPAGGPNDSRRENNNKSSTYFYSLSYLNKDKKKLADYIADYFSEIYEFANRVTSNNAKWRWCSKPRNEIVEEIDRSKVLMPHKEAILRQYDECQKRRYVIYVGDMFYYHETSSRAIPYKHKNDSFYQNYCKEMLEKHIAVLKEHNKKIKFAYINMAKVSKWLCKNKPLTSNVVEGINVFYGSMLSGRRTMDVFSRERLIQEISKALKE